MRRIYTLSDVASLPPLDWTIDRLLPRGGIAVIGGLPKRGKSRLIFDTIMRGCLGLPAFFEFEQRYKSALIYNAEGGPRGLQTRFGMMEGLPPEVGDNIFVAEGVPCFTQGDGTVDYAATLEEAGIWRDYDLVVLDPLVSFHSCDENDNQQIGALMKVLRRAAEYSDTSLLIVHHTAKPSMGTMGVSDGQRLRGASALWGAADGIIMTDCTHPGDPLNLSIELRYAPPTDGVTLIPDKLTGRFYKAVEPKEGLIEPSDWIRWHGRDAGRFARSFGTRKQDLTLPAAQAILHAT